MTQPSATPTPGLRYAFVHASWHADIVERGRDAFLAEMARHGVPASQIDVIALPGAYEIPLHAQVLARAGRHAAIVACGLVVDGGIYRHDFVADAVVSGLMRVQLDTGVPVFSVSLTPKDFHENAVHRDFFCYHFVEKGAEAARACAQTLAAHAALARHAPE